MRIAMIGQKGAPAVWGGVERHVEHLAAELGQRGHTVTVYARRHYVTPELAAEYMREHAGVEVKFLPTLHTKHLDAITHTFFATLAALLSKADVFHYHGVGPSLLSWIPRVLRPSATVITTFHSPDREHAKWGRFAKFMLTLGEWTAVKCSHQCITVSKELQAYALNTYAAQTQYVPNAVDEPVRMEPSMMTAQFGLKAQEYFLIVSRLIPHKGVHVAIEAFKAVPQVNKKLVIVGDASHTEEYVKSLHALAAGDDRIIFTGFQHGRLLQELLTNAYAFIQPSFSEGLSIALLEAAAYGLPIISSNIEANREVVGEFATLYNPHNTEELSAALIALDAQPRLAQEQAKILRAHVQKTYAWGAVTTQIERVYRNAADRTTTQSQSRQFRSEP